MSLILLTGILAINYIDRQIVIILQEPIKHEFALQDWQLGLITGGVVGLFYTLAGLPLAHFADRGINRTRLITVATAAWSAMTVLCGASVTYPQLVVARVGVGLTEAALVPSAHSLIADLYSAKDRPRAMGVFSTGIPIGMMGGLAIGGVVAQATSWRAAFFVAGAPGILLALLLHLLTREPRRGGMEMSPPEKLERIGFIRAVRDLLGISPIRHIVCAMTACTFVQAGLSSWLPSYLMRMHHLSLANAGLATGVLFGVGGIIGTLFGGWQAARSAHRGQHVMLFLPILGLAGAIPIFAIGFLATTPVNALSVLAVPFILGATWTAPALALLQSLAPVHLRARASALGSMTANLFGISLGPVAIGLLSDHARSWHNGDPAMGLRDAMLCMVPFLGVGIWQWGMASRRILRDTPVSQA